MTRMPSGRLASPTAGRRRPPEANRTDITDFTKEKEKRSKKERENVLRRRCSKPGRGGLVRPLKPGTLLTQVGPVYSPMWVPFTRRLPRGLPRLWHSEMGSQSDLKSLVRKDVRVRIPPCPVESAVFGTIAHGLAKSRQFHPAPVSLAFASRLMPSSMCRPYIAVVAALPDRASLETIG